MISWLGGRQKRKELPRLKPRRSSLSTTKVDIAELTPAPLSALGQAAYVELGIFESLASAVAEAPNLVAKEGLSLAAGAALKSTG